jgi:hypothetical protein
MPAAMPLCSLGTTLTATSAIHRIDQAGRRARDQEAPKQGRLLGARVDAAHQ